MLVIKVGDRMNDAPALNIAAFSLCLTDEEGMCDGVPADAVLRPSDMARVKGLARIPYVIRLCRATQRRTQLGLLWAMVYNFIVLCLGSGASEWLVGLSISPYVSLRPWAQPRLCVASLMGLGLTYPPPWV